MTTLKRFISFSLLIHLLAMSFLLMTPARKEHKVTPFFARLVTPEDTESEPKQPEIREIPGVKKSTPLPPSVTKEAPKELSSMQSAPPSKKEDAKTGGSSSSGGESKSQQKEKGSEDVSSGAGADGKGKKFSPVQGAREEGERLAQITEGQKERSSVTFDAKEFKYYGYMERLKEKIEGIWKYPGYEASRGIYGDLYVNFTIRKDGSLGSVELERTSGHRGLDEAAMKALRDAAPFWPLPEDWKKDSLTIKGHFIYTLYGTYVR